MSAFRIPRLPRPRPFRLGSSPGEIGRLMLLSAVIGLATGLVAVAFHGALSALGSFAVGGLAGGWVEGAGRLPRWSLFALPGLGGLCTGLLISKLVPGTIGELADGTDAAIDAFHNRGGRMEFRTAFLKGISSIVTSGTGGSAGVEGPISQVGAGIGSLACRGLDVSARQRRILAVAGMAAGLGSIFKAPLGGALTSVEVLYKSDFESDAFLPAVVASVTGYATFCAVDGYLPILGRLPPFSFRDPREILLYAALGAAMAFASRLFLKIFRWTRERSLAWKLPFWLKSALAGCSVGAFACAFPAIVGGWTELGGLMRVGASGAAAALLLFALALAKMVATALTVGVTQSGGLFGPSLFVGALLGGGFGTLCSLLFPGFAAPPGAFMLVGMGAFFAGVAHAPIAVVVMVCEIAGDYSLLAPLLVASSVHVALANRRSVYASQPVNKFASPAHRHELQRDILREATVRQVLKPENRPVCFPPEATLAEIRAALPGTAEEIFPVVDGEGRFAGVIDVHELRKAIFDDSLAGWVIAQDMLRPSAGLSPDMDLHIALQKFLAENASQMAVLEGGKVVGTLHQRDLIAVYEEKSRSYT